MMKNVMMKQKLRLCLLNFIAMMTMTSATLAQQPSVAIIPEPEHIVFHHGTFILTDSTVLVAPGVEEQKSASFFAGYLKDFYGFHPQISVSNSSKKNCIIFSINKKVKNEHGAYTLKCAANGISLDGTSPEGLFYAMQSLIQLLPPVAGTVLHIPTVAITDKPRFAYRGMHLDVARHIFPVDFIKRYIDFIALHKMNYFHIHLTDDQGWRLESKKYPQLNTIGSWRDGTIIGLYPGTGFDSTRYGGYYTISQMKEIVQYAADRYITVVPEIDIPGHSMAILAAFPQFSTRPDIPQKTATTWGIFNKENNVLAPSEGVFTFLEDVFTELMDVFPSEYIHIGADECAHKWWHDSPDVQAFIRTHNLADEKGLQHYFVQRVSDIITRHGRTAVGWDEVIDDGGLVGNIVVMSWRNAKNGYIAARAGHKVIMTPLRSSYFNVQQKKNEERLAHKNWLVTASKVYNFEPVPDSLPAAAAANITGGQGCLWTEYFANGKEVEYGIFPRMSAIAEVYWSDRKKRNWANFKEKMKIQFQRYELWKAACCNYLGEDE
jgi:hexosaminidase